MPGCKENYSILAVDDAPDTLELIRRNLVSEGYKVFTASSVQEGIEILESTPIHLVITDLKMPKVSGMDMVRHVRENYKDAEVMMITGYATVESAVEAVKTGAEEYLSKPFTDIELITAVRKTLGKIKKRQKKISEKENESFEDYGIIGKSKTLHIVFNAISKAAKTPATVLITGESGTGKELVARAIHYSSKRASASFIPVNCGGIPETLLESELFGHVKGAFTGATETRAGFFQTADGGTIFLDEISETSHQMQVKLLRVLQDKQICMVGSNRFQKVDVRIAAATNKDLQILVKKELFRDDLFYRLNVINITVPPLRERDNDILILAHYFAEKFAKELGVSTLQFSDKVLDGLLNYNWPGNVRELENVIQRLVVMSEGEIIETSDLPSLMRFSVLHKRDFNKSLADVEAEYIRNVIANEKGNKTRAAEVLGIDRKTLREKMKRYHIDD